MTDLIAPDNPAYVLGVTSIDETHMQFIELVNQLGNAKNTRHFIKLFGNYSA
ncbi:MAG: hypothetical protein KZQ64_09365 [gamma proteobacterium symbiont of Bathyaustriella thionipta]|nr:hypothetical protein [gamma proteobacterium symbiont of Bathyaustriella thionipta]MCU7949470.1 hypothetical protein [gamma proteobacterium symbiont of Bathyaustriella thionipta]MCU7953582.1 hypothetical protein [gamma proteobacterium symbiont of Bathyaustriella thionipta]MCU7955938.1 hypothetical protein [gamma proteobacterium symbiont of Bathyaustriella thionipta]MCU7968555.1 hypothetical protein [gamma proteobacterium symbiont of Bathyaustriella thionipta]